MTAPINPHPVCSRQLEEIREKDPDGQIVVHHRTVDTLGNMLRAGTIHAGNAQCCTRLPGQLHHCPASTLFAQARYCACRAPAGSRA